MFTFHLLWAPCPIKYQNMRLNQTKFEFYVSTEVPVLMSVENVSSHNIFFLNFNGGVVALYKLLSTV